MTPLNGVFGSGDGFSGSNVVGSGQPRTTINNPDDARLPGVSPVTSTSSPGNPTVTTPDQQGGEGTAVDAIRSAQNQPNTSSTTIGRGALKLNHAGPVDNNATAVVLNIAPAEGNEGGVCGGTPIQLVMVLPNRNITKPLP